MPRSESWHLYSEGGSSVGLEFPFPTEPQNCLVRARGHGGPGSEEPHTLGCSFSALPSAARQDPSVPLFLHTAVVPWGVSRGSGPRDGVGSQGCGPEGRHTQSYPCLSHWTSRQTQVPSLQAFATDSLPGSWDMAVTSPWGETEAASMAQGLQTATLTKHLLQERPGTLGEGDKRSRVSMPCKQRPILEPVPSPHHMDHPPCPPRCCLRKGAHFG